MSENNFQNEYDNFINKIKNKGNDNLINYLDFIKEYDESSYYILNNTFIDLRKINDKLNKRCK